MPFGMRTRVDRPNKALLNGVHIGATWRIRLNRTCADAMRPYVKLLWPLIRYCHHMPQYSDRYLERQRQNIVGNLSTCASLMLARLPPMGRKLISLVARPLHRLCRAVFFAPYCHRHRPHRPNSIRTRAPSSLFWRGAPCPPLFPAITYTNQLKIGGIHRSRIRVSAFWNALYAGIFRSHRSTHTTEVRPIVTDGVAWSVCLSVTIVSPAKTA